MKRLKEKLRGYGANEMKKNNNKVSIRHLYDEVIPMIENIAGIKTDVSNIKEDIGEIKESNKSLICVRSKSE